MTRRPAQLLAAFAVAAALAGCASPTRSPPRVSTGPATSAAPAQPVQAPGAPAAPPPPDILATAPAGADGIPVPVQGEVDRFEGRHVKLKVSDMLSLGGGVRAIHTYNDTEEGSEYTFDGLGALIGYFHGGPPGPPPNVGDSRLSDAQLTAEARTYVRTHFDARQAAWPGTVERRVCGIDQNGKKNYEISVELRERAGDVPSPNFIRLSVNRQGAVLSFVREDGPSVKSTRARISKDRAVRIAAEKAGCDDPKVTKADLSYVRDAQGTARLVWTIELDPPPPPPNVQMMGGHIWATVDAVSGALLSYGTS